jgi:hypothetical protein
VSSPCRIWYLCRNLTISPVSAGKPEVRKNPDASLPTAVVDEELLQPREPFAVADREIAGLKLVAQLEQQGALPGPPVNLALVYHDGFKKWTLILPSTRCTRCLSNGSVPGR